MDHHRIKELVQYMLIGDESTSWKLISEWIKGRDSVFLFEDILAAAMRYVGDLWEINEITVADEHVASNVCNLLISRYTLDTIPANGSIENEIHSTSTTPKAMLFCIEGEQHSLGMKLVSSLFKEHGWDTRYLGANLPTNDSIIYANRWRPDVIGISVSLIYNLPALTEFLKRIDQLEYEPKIIVGGRITSLYHLESDCPENVLVLKDLYNLEALLLDNKLCNQPHAIT
ncbi:cobalamin-dependent protein [Bacillus luteolus]|uniref:Cobalamin-dependent protein n=1 Tax=Litchfieldia luteola TaxID=682179 RepID=A0ABR9QFK1_9BACI|nr:cobalamin-dependent protein [Cytobacillus luteolus]MBE4907264.1 cobalamin-dependent protein [Cytobacillus luteolus]MBP1943256.1 methanogenic corrinoid protein MtbC1 [Cytobacillus luteolus]